MPQNVLQKVKYYTNMLLVAGKRKRKRVLGRSRCRWEDFIKALKIIDLKKLTSIMR
jgi:hypothetical protein